MRSQGINGTGISGFIAKCSASTVIIASVLLLLSAVTAGTASAECRASFFNPLADVCWHCVFPVRIGGITMVGTDIDTPSDHISNPVCLCGTTLGLTASLWEPARVIETVKDPYCFNLIGVPLSNPSEGFLAGGYRQDTTAPNTFQQAHWYLFPLWAMLDLFIDMPCTEIGGFDIAYMTEIDPTWNDDVLGFMLNPEALLFANPVTQLACMADSVASTVGVPLSPLFWCMGSWGSAYPLTGHINNDSYVQDNAALAARMIYKMSRELLLWDTGLNECGAVMMPIWVKENYRMHIMKPARDHTCHPVGRSGLIWATMKNPPGGSSSNAPDNFDWMLFRKRVCCVGYSL